MNIVSWESQDRDGNPRRTKLHVTIDGLHAVCNTLGRRMPDDITIETRSDRPWQEQVTCYNCAYRLAIRGKLGDYEAPRNGSDFPLRRRMVASYDP